MDPCSIFPAFQQFLSFFSVTLPIFSTLLQDAGTRKPRWCKAESEVNTRVTDIKQPPHPDSWPLHLSAQNHGRLFQLRLGTKSSPELLAHSNLNVLTRDWWGHSPPLQITFRTCLSRFLTVHLRWFCYNSTIYQTNCITPSCHNSPNLLHLHMLPVVSQVFFCITE